MQRAESCKHRMTEQVIDELGMMTEQADGTVSAPVKAWSVRCQHCFQVLSRHGANPFRVPEPEPVKVVLP